MQRPRIITLSLTLSFLFLASLWACQDKNVSHQQPDPKNPISKSAPAQVYVDGGCREALVKEIGAARSSIFVQAHSHVPARAAQALVDAHERDVKVEVITGKGSRKTKYDPATSLANAGIPVYIDNDKQASKRSPIILIDEKLVIAGALECNKSSDERYIESLTVVRSPEFTRAYMSAWAKRKQQSRALQTKPDPQRKIAPKRTP